MQKKVTIDKKKEWLPPYNKLEDSFESSDSEIMVPKEPPGGSGFPETMQVVTADEATTLHSEGLSSSEQADPATTLHSEGRPRAGQATTTTTMSTTIKAMSTLSYACAWLCILFVPLWKVFDTSFLFRERDEPSMFDNTVDYFSSDSSWPFAKRIDNGKDTYRLYFFVMPFFLGFLFLFAKGVGENYCKVTSFKLSPLLRYRFSFGLSVMDLFLIAATLIYSAILLWVRMKRSLSKGAKKLTFLYQDDKEPLETYSWEGAEIMGKTLGRSSLTTSAHRKSKNSSLHCFYISYCFCRRFDYHPCRMVCSHADKPSIGPPRPSQCSPRSCIEIPSLAWVVLSLRSTGPHACVYCCLGPRQWSSSLQSRRQLASPHDACGEL